MKGGSAEAGFGVYASQDQLSGLFREGRMYLLLEKGEFTIIEA